MSLDALAPDPDLTLPAAEPKGGAPSRDPAAPVWTRTLAELYVKQGFVDKALEVLRHLHGVNPGADDIATRIAELEAGDRGVTVADPPPVPAATPGGGLPPAPPSLPDEVESQARDLADSGAGEHEVDTPFAWTEAEGDHPDERASGSGSGPPISEYFDGLLGWRPRE